MSSESFKPTGMPFVCHLPYNFVVNTSRFFKRILYGSLILMASGCATELYPWMNQDQIARGLVIGRTVTVVAGERARRYQPQVRLIEVENQDTQERV